MFVCHRKVVFFKHQMDHDAKFIARKLILDIILLLCVGIPILIYFLIGEPYKRGFYCNDESLMHPYNDSTVPSYYLYIFGLGMPLVLMTLTEYIHSRDDIERYHTVGNKKVPRWIWNAYSVIIVFGFGAACSQLSTDIMKYTVGRLRPHFFRVCKPIIDGKFYDDYCNDTISQNLHQYIEHFTCSNDSSGRILKEMRLSFPSGHSSFSMYTMFYLAMYLQSRWTWEGSKLFRHVFQYFFLILSLYTGMTRISDYKHHWSDVLAGLLLGMFAATLNAYFVSDLFKRKQKPNLLPTAIDGSESEMSSRNRNGGTSQI